MELGPARPWWLLPTRRVAPYWWPLLIAPLLAIEYVTGSYERLPVLYFVPVCLAAFYSGRWVAVVLGLSVAGSHLIFTAVRTPDADFFPLIVTSIVRCGVITVIALWLARLSDHERALEEEVQTLKGLLPICSFCKSIRNDTGEWERLEHYVSRRSEAEFSHGVCPPCEEEHYAAPMRTLRKSRLTA